jgi:hypothetical protein
MNSIAPRLSFLLTASLLAAGLLLLAVGRLDYCGRIEAPQPRVTAVTTSDSPSPTLAPPLKVVFVHVEADKSDIEVGWLDN